MVNGTDMRIAHGARCIWWDSISKVGTRNGMPCCPFCRNVLLECPSEEEWFKQVDKYEALEHSGYRAFVEWLRGKCFKNSFVAKAVYERATGKSAGY